MLSSDVKKAFESIKSVVIIYLTQSKFEKYISYLKTNKEIIVITGIEISRFKFRNIVEENFIRFYKF